MMDPGPRQRPVLRNSPHLPLLTHCQSQRVAFAVSPANPLIAFTTVATESGTLQFRWDGDNGYTVTEIAPIKVE